MFERVFCSDIFHNKQGFNLALGIFTFNLILFCIVLILRAVNGIPDPFTHIAGVGQLHEAKTLLSILALWAIGNSLLLLGFVDAIGDKKV